MTPKDIKKSVINFLTEKSDYQNIDESLIDELVANYGFAIDARKIIAADGIIQNETRKLAGINSHEYNILKRNPALDVYNKAIDNIRKITATLGIGPADRVRLKLDKVAEEVDELSEFDIK